VREVNTTIYHRAACTGNCADAMGNPYLNGCAQGFVPLLYDTTGSMQVDCISYCQPKTCYGGTGNCGTGASGNLQGDPAGTPNRLCTQTLTGGTNSEGQFQLATLGPTAGTNNGDQCMYEWLFELGSAGLVRASTSDTVGYCVNHSKYKYDPAGGTNYTTPWDKCDTLTNPTFGSAAATPGAADFGCVDTTTGMVMLQGKQSGNMPVIHIDRPHTLYHRTFAQ
jgi:hypothetical protein